MTRASVASRRYFARTMRMSRATGGGRAPRWRHGTTIRGRATRMGREASGRCGAVCAAAGSRTATPPSGPARRLRTSPSRCGGALAVAVRGATAAGCARAASGGRTRAATGSGGHANRDGSGARRGREGGSQAGLVVNAARDTCRALCDVMSR